MVVLLHDYLGGSCRDPNVTYHYSTTLSDTTKYDKLVHCTPKIICTQPSLQSHWLCVPCCIVATIVFPYSSRLLNYQTAPVPVMLTISGWRHMNQSVNIHGFVQHSNISVANALEILQSCTKPSLITKPEHNIMYVIYCCSSNYPRYDFEAIYWYIVVRWNNAR